MISQPSRILAGNLVPNSSARAEVLRRDHGNGQPNAVAVRCGGCNRRQFDLVEKVQNHALLGIEIDRWWEVERLCPRCSVIQSRQVTIQRGRAVGESGPWRCSRCERALARVDAARGRLSVKCRCGTVVRATTQEVIASVRDAEVPVRQLQSDLDDSVFDGVPF